MNEEEKMSEAKEHFKGREDELYDLIRIHIRFPYQEFKNELIKFYEMFLEYGGGAKISYEIIKAIISTMHDAGFSKEKIKDNLYSIVDVYFRQIDTEKK